MTVFGKVKIDGVLASPFIATNATAITSTTPVEIKAAVASKRHWVTGISFSQPTAAEAGVLTVQDGNASPVPIMSVGFDGALQSPFLDLGAAIPVASGEAIDGKGSAATGDAFITVVGYVED